MTLSATITRLSGCLALCTVAATAQINVRTVVNAASYLGPGLPGSGIAQGARFAVLGDGLGPAEAVEAGAPLPAADGLGGVSIQVSVAGTTVDALMLSASATRVLALLPSRTPTGAGRITVKYGDQTSAADIQVVATAMGIYTRGTGSPGPQMQGVADDGSAVDLVPSRPARPGQTVVLYGTGLGAVTGDEASGPLPGSLDVPVDVFVAGKTATVTAKGRSDRGPGIDQISFQVPAGVEGCNLPVAVRAAGTISNFVTLAAAAAGGCVDPAGFSASDLEQFPTSGAFRTGSITLVRSSAAAQGVESTSDAGSASFISYKAEDLGGYSGFGGRPAIGSCLVNFFTEGLPDVRFDYTLLDAGPSIMVTGPKGTKEMTRRDGVYSGSFSTSISLPSIPGLPLPGDPPYLEPGPYTVTAPGGADIGAFTARVTLPPALNWTNRASVGTSGPDTALRTSDLRVTWTGGGADDIVTITGSASAGTTPGRVVLASFTCLERAAASQFTVPAWVLSTLPAARQGFLSLSLSPAFGPNRFTASGLDLGYTYFSSGSARTIAYQ